MMNFERKKSNFFILTYLFFLFVFFISLFLNINKYREIIENKSTLQIELKEELKQNEIEVLEQKLWKIKEVKNLKYYSKERGLKRLVKELEISIPEVNNPLSDLIIINVLGVENKKKIIDTLLETEKNIVSFHFNEVVTEQTTKESKNLKNILLAVLILGIVPIIYMIYSMFINLVYEKYLYYYQNSQDEEKAIKLGKKVLFLPLVASAISGSAIYYNLYLLFKRKYSEEIVEIFRVSEIEIVYSTFGLVFCIVLMLIFIPIKFKDRPRK
jgi:hypothetical protein